MLLLPGDGYPLTWHEWEDALISLGNFFSRWESVELDFEILRREGGRVLARGYVRAG